MLHNDCPSNSVLARLIHLDRNYFLKASKLRQVCCFIAMCLCMQVTHAQESNENTKVQINAELVGMSEDGKEVTVRITNHTDRRVKKLAGFVNFINDKGSHVPDAPMTHVSFLPYCFDEKPTLHRTWAVPDKAITFKKMMRDNPAGAHAQFDVTNIEFDENIDAIPKREVKRTVTKDGDVSLEYSAQSGGVVFAGRVIQRWGQSWLLPLKGLRLEDKNSKVIRTATFTLRPPKNEANSQWRWSIGMNHDASITDTDGSVKIDKTWWSVGGPFAVDTLEMKLPVHSTQLPLLLPDLETYWIPFRSINNHDDAFILIFATDEQTIRRHIKHIPLWRGHEPNWANIFSDGDLGSTKTKSE